MDPAGNRDRSRPLASRPFRPLLLVQFYLLAPPRQTDVFYDEVVARSRFESLSGKDANQAA